MQRRGFIKSGMVFSLMVHLMPMNVFGKSLKKIRYIPINPVNEHCRHGNQIDDICRRSLNGKNILVSRDHYYLNGFSPGENDLWTLNLGIGDQSFLIHSGMQGAVKSGPGLNISVIQTGAHIDNRIGYTSMIIPLNCEYRCNHVDFGKNQMVYVEEAGVFSIDPEHAGSLALIQMPLQGRIS